MNKLLVTFILFFFLISALKSQNVKLDSTISNKKENFVEVNSAPDSLVYIEDSLPIQEAEDTLVQIQKLMGIAPTEMPVDTLLSLKIDMDTRILLDRISEQERYENILNYVNDSLYFDQADSIHYVIHNLNNLIQSDSIPLSDSTRQAIGKLIDYTKNREIESALNYLRSRIEKLGLLDALTDSSLQTLNESISLAVEYLIQTIPEDSVKFSFTNLKNDSILFESAENEIDSIHLNLFDNRGEYAVLWIKKSDLNVFDVFLEDGVFLEKAQLQGLVDHKLENEIVLPGIREARKVDIIVGIWDFDGLSDIRFNQGYISESWAEGGENSLSALSILRYSADYSYGKQRNLDTDFEYRLGYLKAGDNDLQKNDDKLEINAKYGRVAINDWYYSALLNFRTQLLKGFEYNNDTTKFAISEFMSPAYLVFSLGLDYKPSNKLTVLLSPLTSKFTIVADTINYDQTHFGVGQDEFIRKEVGAYIKAISKLKFRDNIVLENKINFFTNYTNNPQNIDVDWEVNLNVKLTDYIKMSINAHFVHDDDVAFIDQDGRERGARAQFKELFGIGFLYSF